MSFIRDYRLLGLLLALLAGCGGAEHQDLRQWMEENTRDLRGKVAPLPDVVAYQPVPYEFEGQIDPFRPAKIQPDANDRRGEGKSGKFQPDFEARERRNSPLERYPLESLTMIGKLVLNNRPMAVIKFDDKVQQVKVGDYIGLDFGLVTEIRDNELKLRELIQNSDGEWEQRDSALILQTTEGSSK